MDTADRDHRLYRIASEYPDKDAAFNMLLFAMEHDCLHEADLPDLQTIADNCRKADGDAHLRLCHLGEALQYESIESLANDAKSNTLKADIRERARAVLNELLK